MWRSSCYGDETNNSYVAGDTDVVTVSLWSRFARRKDALVAAKIGGGRMLMRYVALCLELAVVRLNCIQLPTHGIQFVRNVDFQAACDFL